MSIKSLTCPAPVRKAVRLPQLDFELFDQAIEHFGQGEFSEALLAALHHRFPEHDIPADKSGSFSFLQGSSEVSLRWDEQRLSLSVPLVTLPEGGRMVAALRYLVTNLGGWGQLLHPRLHGQEVYLEFEDPLSRCHPVKVLQLLESAPAKADMVDDWMVDQFGASPLGNGSITPLVAEELERAELIWRAHWAEVAELVAETQRKRSMFLLNEVTAYALFHLKQALPISGSLGTRLGESADIFNNTDEDPDRRLAALTKCAKEFSTTTTQELGDNLGHGQYSISPLAPGDARALKHHLGPHDYLQSVDGFRKEGELLTAAVALITTYHFLLAMWSWPEPIEDLLQDGITRASEKPWREAFEILWEQAPVIVAQVGDEAGSEWGDPDDDGEDGDAGEDGDEEVSS